MSALELELLGMEAAWYLLLVSIQWKVRKSAPGGELNFFDQGPWWSVAFHRVWLAGHIPAMVLQLLLNGASRSLRGGKELGLPMPLFHLANYGLLLLMLRVPAR